MPEIAEPASAEEIARVLAGANADGLAVAPRGGGTKLGIGHEAERVDLVLSTARLDRLVEHAHADLTATVEVGCTVGSLQRALAERGQRLALDPPWPDRATVGGVLSTNDSGPLRTRFGPVRNLLLGVTVVLADGTIARSGGKVVKNVAGYDLPKLVAGSLGTLGVVVEATFRLHPVPRESCDATFAFRSATAASEYMARVGDSQLSPACAQLRAASGEPLSVDVRLEGAAGSTRTRGARLREMAHDGEPAPSVWEASERLRTDAGDALVLKAGVLPAQSVALATRAAELATGADLTFALTVQSDGVGFVRFDGDRSAFAGVVAAVRETAGVEHAVVFDCPAEVKRGLDVWGVKPDALALMRRLKERFDPRGTLNAGRFAGGI